ncbi:MAG: hypothetical protein J6R18_08035, partial [Kiritimatiellae bacterium]|nr:hypothetical protein [Kiritimatiellia bacterium]
RETAQGDIGGYCRDGQSQYARSADLTASIIGGRKSFVRFFGFPRISVCSPGASGRESPDRSAAANPYVRCFFRRRPDFVV